MAVRYVPNRAGLEELARGGIAQGLVHQYAEQKRSAAGGGFETSYQQGATRYRGMVFPDTWSAVGRDRRDNILVRVLG